MTIRIRAYAKVNLFLRVTSLRADGFHEIQTVMHPVGIWDEIHAEKRPGGLVLESDTSQAPAGEENTVFRAWMALRQHCPGGVGGCRIVLRKGIPTQAGLGGASTDAAAALLVMDRLFGLGLPSEALHVLAAKIGSDAPFFLGKGAAVATGKGEHIRAIPSALEAPLVLALSNRGVSTAEAYGRFCPDASEEGRSTTAMEQAVAAGEPTRTAEHLFNTFERLIFPVRPDLAQAKTALQTAGAAGALMTGSGATVFGIGLDEGKIRREEIFPAGEEGRLVWTAFHRCPHEWL